VGTRVKRHQLGEAPASGIQIPTLWNRTRGRAALGGTAISSEQPGPEGIALDAGHLYWANCGGRTAAAELPKKGPKRWRWRLPRDTAPGERFAAFSRGWRRGQIG
jgi:hypothetical protein